MNAIRSVLRDRKRAQRGGILSGVLIMTAFIAILSAALMTELSGNFLLSANLMNRINYQATVNSAVELGLSQMQSSAINTGCPSLTPTPISLNGVTAIATYSSCWPTVSEQPQYARYSGAATFNADGAHVVISRAGVDLYLVGDSGGNVYQFTFGHPTPNWTTRLAGSVSGPPLAAPDLSSSDLIDIVTLVPLSVQSNPPSGCAQGGCVALLTSDATGSPDGLCYMAASGPVTVQPASGVSNPNVAFFGDRQGNIYAYAATAGGNCAGQATPVSIGQPVVAGPVVFAGPGNGSTKVDTIYAVTSDGTSSWLRQLTFSSKNGQPATLMLVSSVPLPAPNAFGLAVDRSTARAAITFAGGAVALVQMSSMSLLGSAQLPAGIADAPAWCCGSSPTTIGVAATNALYVLNTNLSVVGSYSVSGTTISTSPAADSAGDWFFAANDGNLYEAPAIQSTPALVTLGSGQLGRPSSSIVVAPCSNFYCVHLGSSASVYRFQLDARQAVIGACVSSGAACSGVNPRLWANVEVGAIGSPQTVHVEGWSYYSG